METIGKLSSLHPRPDTVDSRSRRDLYTLLGGSWVV